MPTPEGMTETQEASVQDGNQSIVSQIDMDELKTYILNTLKNDIRDREEFGWNEKRQYDINAYEGKKKPTSFPWKNASNFPVPLTSTLVETAHANILGSIFDNPEKILKTKGVGKEDIRLAPSLSDVLNWQLANQINTFEAFDSWIMAAFKQGTGVMKATVDIQEDKTNQGKKKAKFFLENIPVENMFVPIEATGSELKSSSFNGVEFKDSKLTDCALEDCRLQNCDLSDCELKDCEIL